TTGNALWSSPLTFVEASTPGAGGFIDTANQRFGIQHVSPIKSAKDLAGVAIVDTEGRRLRLSDLADVVEGHQPLSGDAVLHGGPSLVLVIERFPGASIAEVTSGLEQALDAMRPGLAGVEIDTHLYRPASYLESAFGNLRTSLLVGLVLLIAVLAAFFVDWRAGPVSVVGLAPSPGAARVVRVAGPAALLAAVLGLAAFAAARRRLVGAGLLMALAVVVDDAVATVAQVRQRLREPGPDAPTGWRSVVLTAAGQARVA